LHEIWKINILPEKESFVVIKRVSTFPVALSLAFILVGGLLFPGSGQLELNNANVLESIRVSGPLAPDCQPCTTKVIFTFKTASISFQHVKGFGHVNIDFPDAIAAGKIIPISYVSPVKDILVSMRKESPQPMVIKEHDVTSVDVQIDGTIPVDYTVFRTLNQVALVLSWGGDGTASREDRKLRSSIITYAIVGVVTIGVIVVVALLLNRSKDNTGDDIHIK